MIAKILLICGVAIGVSVAFPTGAPSKSCPDMDPGKGHHGFVSKPIEEFPYKFEANGENYSEGTKIEGM